MCGLVEYINDESTERGHGKASEFLTRLIAHGGVGGVRREEEENEGRWACGSSSSSAQSGSTDAAYRCHGLWATTDASTTTTMRERAGGRARGNGNLDSGFKKGVC